ncbi:MAG: KEOPS complex subunit Pcc1 [Candidatus Thermoplasmatota archaeon]|nr:KEOPS complex subunit Pcc1 [Candidatus Thermoplasmatota archaeon]
MHKAVLNLEMDKELAAHVAKALRPETAAETKGTRFAVEENQNGLSLILESEDASGLRAALNSYARLAKVALDMACGQTKP